MERRMLLAVLLSFFVVTLYGMATGQCSPQPKPEGDEVPEEGPETPGDGPDAPAPVPAPGPGGPAPAPAPAPQPGDGAYPKQAADRVAKRVTIQTHELDVVLSERGAGVEGITLRNSYENDKERELVVIVPFADDLLLGQVDDQHLDPTDLTRREGGFDPPGGDGRADLPAGPMRNHIWTA